MEKIEAVLQADMRADQGGSRGGGGERMNLRQIFKAELAGFSDSVDAGRERIGQLEVTAGNGTSTGSVHATISYVSVSEPSLPTPLSFNSGCLRKSYQSYGFFSLKNSQYTRT